ncbi:HD domain-containing protein [Variovorax sp. RA8]|uniref:HD domain-containing protein n=1 Tax=Variovorax sp. (strain JCM 16519 / RA8) TaxID=662548 RepID=UPI000A64C5FE|nr:HD domain-containing protein [Variovorax sp. RA8]VTU44286.1 Bifunctional (p)ppGpp synthase/hydrolase relA [Variovorax sp. RA8]
MTSAASRSSKALLARAFAVQAHGDQMYGPHPYVHHLDAVAALARTYGEDAEVTAYLHDVKEDVAGMSLDALRERFGDEVTEAIDSLSDPPGANRGERKARAYARLAGTTSRLALTVKPCDRLANMRACVEDGNERLLGVYRSEHEAFRTAAYRSGLCDAIWDELDVLAQRPINGDFKELRPRA